MCASPPLTEPSFHAAGGAVAGVAAGDLDGDGDIDIAVTRPASNSIAILYNNGSGAFGVPQAQAVGTTPVGIAAGDFNGDGMADLAVANSGANTLTIFISTGGGSFASPVAITTGTEPRAVAVGDFNGDTNADLVVANAGSNNAWLFFGTGTGSFGPPATRLPLSMSRPVAIAVGRLGRDAKDDFVLVGRNSNNATIFYEETPSITKKSFNTGTTPVAVALIDLDRDLENVADVVIANQGSSSLTVQLLTPGGLLTPQPAAMALPFAPSAIAAGDFNGDRRADLVVVSETSDELLLMYHSGIGSFAAPIRYRLSSGSGAVFAGDVNLDGRSDVLSASSSANGVSFLQGADWPRPSKPYFMLVADTSSSMTTGTNMVPGFFNTCSLPATRLNDLRCALRKFFVASPDVAELGLATFPIRQTNCAAGCYTSCTYSAFPEETVTNGCGPRVGDASTRRGAFIRVPVRQDNFWTSPAPPDNRAELGAWTDNVCSDNRELFASGANTPLNGVLRDMKRYFEGTWSAPDGSVSYPTPLSSNDRSCRSLNIILVTDGDETCDTQADAVASAADLFNNGVTVGGNNFKVRTHVINLAGGTQSNADAIAGAGGTGSAFFATNENDLSLALQEIVRVTLVSQNAVENCDAADQNCNGCADEGWLHSAIATNSGPVCVGGDVQLRANTFPGATYSWSGPNGFSATGQYATVPAATASGSYTFTATVGGCISVSGSTGVVVTAPAASIAAPAQVQAMTSAVASVADAGSGASYVWTVSGATFTGQGTRTITFTAGSAGTVELGVTVQTASGCAASGSRSVPIVTGPVFTDDPLVAGVTEVKAVHLFEARDAVNALRATAGQAAAQWTDAASSGLLIKAVHIVELRQALSPALIFLGRSATFEDPQLAAGDVIRAVHMQEIREKTR